MRFLYYAAKVFNKILDYAVLALIVVFLLFGAYSVADIISLFNAAKTPETVMQYKPVISNDKDKQAEELSLTFSELQNINSDVCAWITIDGTEIDYPIVIGESNSEYLNKSVTGEYSLSGAIFLDAKNDKNFTDPVSVIYGHNMADKAMFGSLPLFLNGSEFSKLSTGTLYTPSDVYELEVVAICSPYADDAEVYSIPKIKSQPISTFVNHINKIAEHTREVPESKTEQYIVLSTCTSFETNGRCILVLKIIN